MGWKNIKEHYKIVHRVRVTDEGVCIGSTFVPNLIVIGLDGKLKTRDGDFVNRDLLRYFREFNDDPEMLQTLFEAPDVFERSVSVFTYDAPTGTIIETTCDEPGWPNVTHDGHIMYETLYSTDRSQVVTWAKEHADMAVTSARRQLHEAEADVCTARANLAQYETAKALLDRNYPNSALDTSAS